jgi:undecaprenyl-diphosphatase
MPAEFLDAVERLDLAAFQWLRGYHSPFLDLTMAGLSDVARGDALWIGLSLLIAAIHPLRWPAAVQVLLAIGLTFLLTESVAKPSFSRARPFESHADTRIYGYAPTTRSFPSGHAANAVAAAFALARLAPEGRAIFWAMALLVGISRVYLGVHYPADVIAGGLLGFAVATLVVGGTTWRHLI